MTHAWLFLLSAFGCRTSSIFSLQVADEGPRDPPIYSFLCLLILAATRIGKKQEEVVRKGLVDSVLSD
jgi:hypothetical protein